MQITAIVLYTYINIAISDTLNIRNNTPIYGTKNQNIAACWVTASK